METLAPGRSKKAETEMVRTWHRWVADLIPEGANSRAIARRDGIIDEAERAKVANSSAARFLRRITNGEVNQPHAATICDVAKAAQSLGKKWCAEPLCLFAAGQFAWFAKIMLDVPDALISTERKIALVAMAAEAANPPESLENDVADLQEYGASSNVVDAFVESRQKAGTATGQLSEARDAWTLRPKEEAAFRTAVQVFRRSRWEPKMERQTPIIVCWLAQKHPEIGLDKQREIVTQAVVGRLLQRSAD